MVVRFPGPQNSELGNLTRRLAASNAFLLSFYCHQETPKFGGEESQADVQDKLQHMRSMMTYLEASRWFI